MRAWALAALALGGLAACDKPSGVSTIDIGPSLDVMVWDDLPFLIPDVAVVEEPHGFTPYFTGVDGWTFHWGEHTRLTFRWQLVEEWEDGDEYDVELVSIDEQHRDPAGTQYIYSGGTDEPIDVYFSEVTAGMRFLGDVDIACTPAQRDVVLATDPGRWTLVVELTDDAAVPLRLVSFGAE